MRKITRRQYLKSSIHLGRTLSAVVAVPYIVQSSEFPGLCENAGQDHRFSRGGSSLDNYLPRCQYLSAARTQYEMESSNRALCERPRGRQDDIKTDAKTVASIMS